MSAYMVNKTDIDQLIAVLRSGPSDAKEWAAMITPEFGDELGEILIKENLSSIHYRYPDTETNPKGTPFDQYWLKPYEFEQCELPTRDRAIELIRCYQYQSCEHPEWEASAARRITDAMKKHLASIELKAKPAEPRREVKYYSITETAKIIRGELKKAFPDTKFSVRSKSYSMGCHISVHYVDGPPDKAVEAITNQFYGTGFDGMTDSTTYHDTEWNGQLCHFAGSRPSVSRSFTGERILDEFGRSQPNPNGPGPTVERMLTAKWKCDEHYQYTRAAWLILARWDARWETLDRAVEKFFAEGCKMYD